MLKLKDIEKHFNSFCAWRTDNNQQLCIKSCALGQNFYDYGDEPPIALDFSECPELKGIENDPRIIIIMCEDCCGCASW